MSQSFVEQAVGLLGLGEIDGWGIKGDKASVYAVRSGDSVIVGQGDARSAPEVLLNKLADVLKQD
jgi:hypothetical protein